MGNRIYQIRPVFCQEIPHDLMEGIVYISKEYKVAIHLCACGCDQKTVMPLGAERGWTLEERGDRVSFTPSIGNFIGENPYHAHYYITDNRIDWH